MAFDGVDNDASPLHASTDEQVVYDSVCYPFVQLRGFTIKARETHPILKCSNLFLNFQYSRLFKNFGNNGLV
jgi:hypothetical protein